MRKVDRERERMILPSSKGGSGLMKAGSQSYLESIDTPPDGKGNMLDSDSSHQDLRDFR